MSFNKDSNINPYGFSTIPDNRLSGDTPLRQTQLILLRLLRIFDGICRKNNLQYWIEGGTLLGAVRHGGFIPWDDDVDVVMPFEDYCRFKTLPDTEFPKDVFLQTEKTDIDFICPWVKLRDRFSYIEEAGGPYPYSQAASLDIFPVVFATEAQHKSRNWYAYLSPYNKKKERIVKHLKLKSKCRILLISSIHSLFIILIKIPFIRSHFERKYSIGKKAWEYFPTIRWDNRYNNNDIFPLQTIKFEGYEFLGPANPHNYLTNLYGDYMTPPPPEKRCSDHAVVALFPIGPNPHFSALKWSDYYDENGKLKSN